MVKLVFETRDVGISFWVVFIEGNGSASLYSEAVLADFIATGVIVGETCRVVQG